MWTRVHFLYERHSHSLPREHVVVEHRQPQHINGNFIRSRRHPSRRHLGEFLSLSFFFLKLSSYYATVNDVIIHTTKCQDFVYFQDGSRIVLKNAIRLASGGRRVARWRFTIIELVIYNNYFNCSPKLVVFNNFILVISLKKPMKFGPVRRSIIEHTFARPANEKNVPTKKKRSMALRVLPLQILNINDN